MDQKMNIDNLGSERVPDLTEVELDVSALEDKSGELTLEPSQETDRIEWVDIITIDEITGEQIVIGQSTRSAMRLHKLLHKATYLIVHDSNNNILIQKRTLIKDYYPGYWDAAAGGVVQANEDWYVSMKREAEEELGIADIPFVDHGEFYFTDKEHHILGRLYSCIATGPFDLQVSEIEQVDWVKADDVFERQSEFTPDSIFALAKWNSRNSFS